MALLREIPSRGIIHCYTGTVEFAKRFLDLGFYISISGIVTFKPAENVREVARILPDDRFLIETDSPFLAPVPLRGQPNEPAFIVHTCEFLAKLRGKFPRDFELMPGERFMVVGHKMSDEIQVYRFDRAACTLEPVGDPIAAWRPLCFKFAAD